ncbi:hypothetical protein LI038_14985, partial [Clostridium perfringens]|uniref:hypothetical protein n=1 Tax=Clostridium perfringens TaxID=1502 RepID=UPI0022466B8B
MNKLFKESNQKTNEVKEVTINVFGEPIVFQYTVEEMENKLLPNNKLDETSKKLFAAWGIKIDPEKKARDLKIKHIHSRIEDIKLNIKVLGAKDGIELYEGSYGADIISKKAREVFGENIAFSYVDSENVKNKLKEQEKELAEIEKDVATVTVIINGEAKTLPAPKKLPKVNPLKKLKPLKKEVNVEEKIIVTLNLDSIGFDRKPTGKEIGAIQNRLDNNISTIDIEEFAKAVALEGRTFKAAAVEGKTNHDWLSQDIFAIDIDNEYGKREKEHPYLSMEDAYKRCEKYNVMPIFIYPSFSSTPEFNKYRLVFRVPITVTDLRVRRFMILALMEIFPERDKSCIDAARTFFGGCQELYKFDPKATINPLDLNFSIFQYLNDTKKTNSSSAIKNFCKRTGLNMFNGIPDIRLCDDENIINDGNLYIYKYRDERILLNFNIKEDEISNLNNKNYNENSKSKFKINNIKG